MKNNEVKSNDKIVFEVLVSLDNDKFDTLLTITEKHLLFQKKKGIFKKHYKITKDILIDDIKVIKDKVKIEQKKNAVTLYTTDDEFKFVCENKIMAKRIIEEIDKLILGEDFLKRTSKKGIKIFNTVKNTATSLGLVTVAAVGAFKAIKENKDVIVETIKTFIKK